MFRTCETCGHRMVPSDEGEFTCPECQSNAEWNEPRMCDICEEYATTTRTDAGQFICELCQVGAEYGPAARDEVLAVQAEMEARTGRRVSIDEAVSEWFGRFLERGATNSDLPAVGACNGGVTHGAE